MTDTVSGVLVKILKKHGIRHVFGLPAAAKRTPLRRILTGWDAVLRQSTRIRARTLMPTIVLVKMSLL